MKNNLVKELVKIAKALVATGKGKIPENKKEFLIRKNRFEKLIQMNYNMWMGISSASSDEEIQDLISKCMSVQKDKVVFEYDTYVADRLKMCADLLKKVLEIRQKAMIEQNRLLKGAKEESDYAGHLADNLASGLYDDEDDGYFKKERPWIDNG